MPGKHARAGSSEQVSLLAPPRSAGATETPAATGPGLRHAVPPASPGAGGGPGRGPELSRLDGARADVRETMPRHTDPKPLARRLAPVRRAAATTGITVAALVLGVGGYSVTTSAALADAPGDR